MGKTKRPDTGDGYLGEIMVHRTSCAVGIVDNVLEAKAGWPPESVFPKIAVIMPDEAGSVAARAISVPSWHPTLALTGAACLGAATGIEGTVPWLAAREVGCLDGRVGITTPGGSGAVTAATIVRDGSRELAWISVGQKVVTFHGSFLIEPLAHFQLKEIGECLSLSA